MIQLECGERRERQGLLRTTTTSLSSPQCGARTLLSEGFSLTERADRARLPKQCPRDAERDALHRPTEGTASHCSHSTPRGGLPKESPGDDNGTQRVRVERPVMILPQVHLRKPCYDFSFL